MSCTAMMNISDRSQDYRPHSQPMYFPVGQSSQPTTSVSQTAQHATKHSRDGQVADVQNVSPQTSTSQYLQFPRSQPVQASTHESIQDERSSKRSRSNHYHAPTVVQPSVLTAMGSLVGGTNSATPAMVIGSVPLRRQLSGGALDQYIGAHDDMETDTSEWTRPRSMSF